MRKIGWSLPAEWQVIEGSVGMKYVKVCVVAAAVLLLWAGVARAEREPGYASPGPDGVPRPQPKPSAAPRPGTFAAASIPNVKRMSAEQREERYFLREAAAAGRFESEASRLALAKSQDPRVRAYATALIEHHTAAGTALQYMLQGRGMAPPMIGNAERKTLNRLAKLNGKKFDREYIEQVGLKHYPDDVQLYESAALSVADPMLKAWISNTLPTLRFHYESAERMVSSDVKLAKGPVRRANPIMPARQPALQPTTRNEPLPPGERPAQSMGAGPRSIGSSSR
jgi:putative membrane protein